MPLVRSFVDNEAYHKYDYLIEDACIAVGSICRRLAWPKYLKLVEYYIKILPKNVLVHKITVKILVHVLDAFHFDLSLASVNQTDYFSEKKRDAADNDEPTTAEETTTTPTTTPTNVKQLVSASLANKIHATISKSILPQLFKCLTKRLSSDDAHKVNKREDARNDDEQILRVPMALAILKLLNNLPRRTLELHLPGLLFKVCDMLKSRAISVRHTTRECLMKMIASLPSNKYLAYVFKELGNALTRGYQVHVLCFTVQLVLRHVETRLRVGDLDASLATLMRSVQLELFTTSVSEEKEVKQILAKVMEAKTTSSYNTLELIARFVSPHAIADLLRPLKQQLDECNSRKLLRKIEEALRRIQIGLLVNTGLTVQHIMFLVYGLVSDTFAAIKARSADTTQRKNNNKNTPVEGEATAAAEDKHTSCLIIPHEPKRGGDKPKLRNATNQHVLVEFALQLMHHMLKHNRLYPSGGQCMFEFLI